EFVDEDTDEVVDTVLLWWRDGDGDLVDTLVDALGPLADTGAVWLLTPKAGRAGHVEPSEITESAPTAGLQQTPTVSVGKDWSAARVVVPRTASKRRCPQPAGADTVGVQTRNWVMVASTASTGCGPKPPTPTRPVRRGVLSELA